MSLYRSLRNARIPVRIFFFSLLKKSLDKVFGHGCSKVLPFDSSKSSQNIYTMAHRLLVNVIFTGASVFGRAFTEAYKQAAKASAAGAAAGGPAKAASQGGISTEEAMKILDLEKNEVSIDKLEEKYNYLFDVNSKEKGNSFYLQSKVYYAMDTLKKELEYLEKLKENKNGAASS